MWAARRLRLSFLWKSSRKPPPAPPLFIHNAVPAQETLTQKQMKESDVLQYLFRASTTSLAFKYFKSVATSGVFRHTARTYEAAIVRLAREHRADEVESLLQTMRIEGVPCSETAFVAALRAHDSASRALGTFYLATDLGVRLGTPKPYNILMDALLEEGRLEAVGAVFQHLRRDGVEPNVFTYNVLLKAMCLNARVDVARQLLEEMARKGCSPDEASYSIVVATLCRVRRVDEARELVLTLPHCLAAWNALLHGLCVEYRWREAFKLIDWEMPKRVIPPNVVTFTTLIASLCKVGHVDLSAALLGRMFLTGVMPNVFTLVVIMKCYFDKGYVGDAIDMWRRIVEQKWEGNVFAYNTIIHGLCNNSSPDKAAALLGEMEQNGCPPNVATFSCLINGFSKVGNLDGAVEMWNKMISSGCKPNVIVSTCMVNALCRNFRFHDARQLVDRMQAEGIPPSTVTYNVVIKGLCEDNRVDCAMNILHSMKKQRCLPNTTTYNVLLDGFFSEGNFGEVCRLVNDMSHDGIGFDRITYNIIIRGLCHMGMVVEALGLVGKMIKYNVSPDLITYNTLLHAYCRVGEIGNATWLLVIMDSGNCSPDLFTYTTLAYGLCNVQKLDKAIGLVGKMISEGILPNAVTWNVIVHAMQKNRFIDLRSIQEILIDNTFD